jgi:hypothetical protein
MGMFVVTRSGDVAPEVLVDYATQDGTGASGAHAGIDYVATAGTLLFTPNQVTATMVVPIIGNNIFQADKTFTVSLSDPRSGVIFAPQRTFAAGFRPTSVAVGDFNGDGKSDLAVANYSSNTVSVLLNTTPAGATTPSFAPQRTFATGIGPSSVAVGDFNGDGKPDLALINEGTFQNPGSTVSVLLNTALAGATAPSFAPQQTFATGEKPRSVAVGDFNGDGRPDLVIANSYSDTISVLLNTTPTGATTPSFASQQTFATGRLPLSVAVGDVNGDGKPDLVIADAASNAMSVLLNTTPVGATSPAFAPQQTFTVDSAPISVAVGDFNGDGKPDLAIANQLSDTVSVLLNTTPAGATTPAFAPQRTFTTGRYPWSVTVADFTGDGKLDLAIANANSSTVSVLLNSTPTRATAPSFNITQDLATGSGPLSIVAGDFNGDGKPDLAIANGGSATVSVLLNTPVPITPTLSFTPPQTFASGGGFAHAAVGDFNGDGKPDLAVANINGTVSVLLNMTPAGATAPSFAPQRTFATGRESIAVAVGDFNGDGKPDLAVADLSGGVSVLLNTTPAGATTPSFAPQRTFATGYGPEDVAVGEFNSDGKPDLVVANYSSYTVSVLVNTTPAGATIPSFAPQQTFATGGPLFSVAVGDFNGDGKPDLAVPNAYINAVSVFLNTTPAGATIPSFTPPHVFTIGGRAGQLTVGDFNGDGKPDLAITNDDNSSGFPVVSVLLNTTPAGATTPSFAPPQTFATGGGSIAVGDFNGDGKPDLAVANYLFDTVSVLLNTTSVPTFPR